MDYVTTYAERHVGFSTKQRVRKDRNRTNGRRTLTLYLYLCILGLTWTGCHASEDEQTRQSLQQRRLAMTLQATPATGLAQRWHVFEQTYGLRRPPPGGHYDAAISRPQDELREVGHSYGIRIHFAAEPHGIETLIVQHWADVRREVSPHNQWRLHPMHDSAYASAYFPSSHRHYLLTMEWERHCRPNKRPIAVEVVWHHERGTESALARPWMIKDEPTVSFLEEMHLLQACTTSHRCHIFHNGAPYESSWMNLSPGDYVKIEAYKVEPPHDTDSEGELPMPIATADREESSSWTSSSTSTSTAEVDELHLENAFMSEALLIYRPLGRTPRPHYLIQAMHSTHVNNLVIVMQHWQDLRYHSWRLESVHHTYEADYPQSDAAHIFVVVALCDLPSPLHQVVLNVVQTTATTLHRALAFSPYVDRAGILQANRLYNFCQQPRRGCRVYVNGQLIPEGTRRTITHGDYVRVSIPTHLDEDTECEVADSFQVPAQAEGLQQLDSVGLDLMHRGQVGQPQIVSNLPRPSQASSSREPTTDVVARNHEDVCVPDRADYWIFMATILYMAAIFLGRVIHQPMIKGKNKRRLRRADKAMSNSKILRTLTMAYLVSGANALAINARIEGHSGARGYDGMSTGHGTTLYVNDVPENLPFALPPVAGLPPPGNPSTMSLRLAPDHHLQCTSLLEDSRTPSTELMLQQICFLIEALALRQAMNAFTQTSLSTGKYTLRLEEWLPPACTERFVSPSCEQPDSLPTAQDHVTSFVEQAPVQYMHAPTFLSGDPDVFGCNSKGPYLNVSGVDGALDDLLAPWTSPLPPSLENEFENVFESLITLPLIEADALEELYIYTDGSHGASDHDLSTTWAFCILGYIDGKPRLVDWFGDFISIDPLDLHWIGAVQDGIHSGEASALVHAALWILQASVPGTCAMFSDSFSTLNSALGRFGFGQADPLMTRLRALFQFMQQATPNTTLKHVKAHSGVVGNEFADGLAVKIREGSLAPRPIPRHYAEWFHGNPPRVFMASFILDFSVRPQALPPFDGSCISLAHPELPDEPPHWLRSDVSQEDNNFKPACLQCCTYNVNTLKSSGLVAYLREQFQSKKLFLVGLQETRTSSPTTFDTNFI